MNPRVLGAVVAVAVVAIIVFFFTYFTVDQTETAIVLQFGEPIDVVDAPGLHFEAPWQNVITYDRRILDFEPPAEELIASDQKRLVIDAYARFKIVDPLRFYRSLGTEEVARARLNTTISGALRRVVGNVELQQVISSKRAEIMHQIRDEVAAQAKAFGIDVIDVRIRHADLPEQNSQAVYARMKAERQREAAQFRAEGSRQGQEIRANADRQVIEIRADAQRQAQILSGQGDADNIRIFAEAVSKDKDFYYFYRSLEAYRQSLAGQNTTLVLSPQGEFFRYLEQGPEGVAPPQAPTAGSSSSAPGDTAKP